MEIKYRCFLQNDLKETAKLIKDFYYETPGNGRLDNRKIKKTFSEFILHPEKGTIIICESQETVIGYAIIFFGWSNEHSKNIIFIDELFIQKDFRNKGIASGCVRFIIRKFKKNTASVMLAVEKGNEKVEKLYNKLGFQTYQNKTLVYRIR